MKNQKKNPSQTFEALRQQFLPLSEDEAGKLSGGFVSITATKAGIMFGNSGVCKNPSTCSGSDNSADCQNMGNCDDSTNSDVCTNNTCFMR